MKKLYLSTFVLLLLLAQNNQFTFAKTQTKNQVNTSAVEVNEEQKSEELQEEELFDEEPESTAQTDKVPNKEVEQPKKNGKNKAPQFTLKKPENLIYQDKQVEVYKAKLGMTRGWLNPYYSMQKIVVVNLTDSELTLYGDIFNKVYKQEARQKVVQIAQEKLAKANGTYNAAAVSGGLIGAAVMAGSLGAEISINKGRDDLLGQIKNLVDDKAFNFSVPAKGETTFGFLIERKKDVKPQIALAYAQGSSGQKTYIVQDFDNDLAKRFLADKSLYQLAFFDNALSDKKMGVYFVNAPTPKPLSSAKNAKAKEQVEIEDKAYEQASMLQAINLKLPDEVVEETTQNAKQAKKAASNKPKTLKKLPGLTSANVYPQKDLRIFAYQNIKKEPHRASFDLIKLTPNKKEGIRSIPQNLIGFSFKEIKPGIVEIKPYSVLQPGEYLLVNQDEDLGYEFTVAKPAAPVKGKTK